MNLRSERGAVLVAGLLVLVLLSLLGAASLLSASIETRIITNHRGANNAFYGAEAALDIAAGRILAAHQPDPFDAVAIALPATNTWLPVTDTMAGNVGIIDGTTGFNGFDLDYSVIEVMGTATNWIAVSTSENAQGLNNLAWVYQVTGRARSIKDTNMETMTETLQILQRPLTQYFSFYQGDLSISPETVGFALGGGRIYASGDIYLGGAQNMLLRNSNPFSGNELPLALTAGGEILYDTLQENGGAGGAPAGDVAINIPVTGTAPAVTRTIATAADSITRLLRADNEPLYAVRDDSILRIGVDPLTLVMAGTGVDHTVIDRGELYDNLAASNTADLTLDTLHISMDGGNLNIDLTIDNGSDPKLSQDVTALVTNFNVAAGVPVNFDHPVSGWSTGAKIRANGSIASLTASLNGNLISPPMPGSIVYCPEAQVTADPVDPAAVYGPINNRVGHNPFYPPFLERTDPREGEDVDFTVIDLQRLQSWYVSYLAQNGPPYIANRAQLDNRRLLIYATRTGAGGTGAPQQAIKLVGSRAGRFRSGKANNNANRQQDPTTLVATTIVSDGPIYIDGDFNSAGQNGVSGRPTAIIADAVTVLSNGWGGAQLNQTTGVSISGAWSTTVNAAFFSGRSAGGAGEAEGIEDLLRLVENWTGSNFVVTGTLSSLWTSQWADAEFGNPGEDFNPPTYFMGWDEMLSNPMDQPPWVPTVFLMEREAWQDQ